MEYLICKVEMLESLLKKVQLRDEVICILGLGRVGLPLASVFASSNVKTIGIDNDQERIQLIKNARCPFYDPELQDNLEKAIKSGNLRVEDDIKKVKDEVDIIFVTVGTPKTTENSIDFSQLYGALDNICAIDLQGKMIIMRSTMAPNTTNDIVIPFLENKTNKKAGEDFAVVVCPERILEGKAVKELQELPEIIGSDNKICREIAAELFRKINHKKEILYTSPSGAELAKLFTNIYRYISFALSNEFAIWAERYGLDASELIRIANHNYPRSQIPIPGFVGGPCLSKDGNFLDNNTTFSSIISTAWKLNESIPQHITNNIRKLLGNFFGKKITVLGISFKAGSDDVRDSPSVKLVEILKGNGAKVSVHDPYVKNTLTLSEVLKSPDLVIIATNHKEFKEKISEIKNSKCKIIYDVWVRVFFT